MFGKHFASMYEGSMRGAGSAFFAVWGYVISHMVPNRKFGTTVELNSSIIGFLIGEEESVVSDQIRKMCEPDLKSRTKDEEGRKLVQISEYTYRVVNGDHYRRIRNEEDRREYQRIKQAQYRKEKKTKNRSSAPLNGENEFEDAVARGASQEELDEIVNRHLPDENSEIPEMP